jgi:hypothetical protein
VRAANNKITLISPVIDMKTIQSRFEWVKLEREDVEYKVYIYNNGDPLCSETTKDNYIVLSEHAKSLLKAGEKYSWQVKAFSPEGTIISISSKVQFNIQKDK